MGPACDGSADRMVKLARNEGASEAGVKPASEASVLRGQIVLIGVF